mmetsp:Transcript_6083/g.13588  ORF Transcript_6083/g.13588 Transcript_6083/m.13588 type:complete len:203 (-) Transcript_6083:1417-2025(-)
MHATYIRRVVTITHPSSSRSFSPSGFSSTTTRAPTTTRLPTITQGRTGPAAKRPAAPTACIVAVKPPAATPPPAATASADMMLATKLPAEIPLAVNLMAFTAMGVPTMEHRAPRAPPIPMTDQKPLSSFPVVSWFGKGLPLFIHLDGHFHPSAVFCVCFTRPVFENFLQLYCMAPNSVRHMGCFENFERGSKRYLLVVTSRM